MARINFRVTESNDFSREGASNRRVVLVADGDNADGTGLDKEHLGPFQKGTVIDGRIELLIGSDIQAKFFSIGTLHAVDFPALVIGGHGTTPEDAAALAKTARSAGKGEKPAAKSGAKKSGAKKRR